MHMQDESLHRGTVQVGHGKLMGGSRLELDFKHMYCFCHFPFNIFRPWMVAVGDHN